MTRPRSRSACTRLASCSASAGGAGLAALSSHQPADANCYGLLGGCILFGLFAWIMDRRQKAGREAFPRLRDQIADFAVTYIASEEYRKNNGDGE